MTVHTLPAVALPNHVFIQNCGSQDGAELYPFHPWMPLPWCLKSIIHVTQKAGCPSMTLLAVVV